MITINVRYSFYQYLYIIYLYEEQISHYVFDRDFQWLNVEKPVKYTLANTSFGHLEAKKQWRGVCY